VQNWPLPGCCWPFYDYSAELRNVRSGAVYGKRLLKRATYENYSTAPQDDCVRNTSVDGSLLNAFYARDAYVNTGGALSNVAALSAGLGGAFTYASESSGVSGEFFTCAKPLDFDPNMHVARVFDVRFSPGTDRNFLSFSALWRLYDFNYRSARFGLVAVDNLAIGHVDVEVFESGENELSVAAATPSFFGHRVYALREARNEEGKYYRVYSLEVNDTGGFVTSASGPRPEDFGLPSF